MVRRPNKCALWIVGSIVNSLSLLFAQSVPQPQSFVYQEQRLLFPLPAVEGKSGQQDEKAMTELIAASALCMPSGSNELRIEGHAFIGEDDQHGDAVSFDIEPGFMWRMDLELPSGSRSVRTLGGVTMSQRSQDVPNREQDQEFTGTFPLAFEILEAAKANDASVVDDGMIVVAGKELHKITITSNRRRSKESGSLYFDSQTHELEYFVEAAEAKHPVGKVVLRVVSYSDYRKTGSLTVPFHMEDSFNGVVAVRLDATSIIEGPRHDASYFTFEVK